MRKFLEPTASNWMLAVAVFCVFLAMLLYVAVTFVDIASTTNGTVRYSDTGRLEVHINVQVGCNRSSAVTNHSTTNETVTVRCVARSICCAESTEWVRTIKPGQTIVVKLYKSNALYICKGADLSQCTDFVKCSEMASAPGLE